jgi:hypothetical protein
MTSTELINTTRRQPTTRASASRSSEQRTAEANRRYRDDIASATTRQDQRDVVAGWKRFLEARIFKDATGTYIPFVLNGMVEERAATDTAAERRRRLTDVCESSTLALNPKFSKSHPRRHVSADSVGIIVLPATTVAGTNHLHGFLRLPTAHPHARSVVAACLMSTFQTRNLWTNDVSELQQDGASLDYLAKTWKTETRHWEDLEFVPSHVFARLTGKR